MLSHCRVWLCDSVDWLQTTVWLLWTVVHQAPLSMGFSRQQYGVGCLSFLQEIFATQGLKPSLLHLLHWPASSLPLSSLRSQLVIYFTCRPVTHFEYFLQKVCKRTQKVCVQVHSFACGRPVDPAPFVEDTVCSIVLPLLFCQRSVDCTFKKLIN